MTADRTEIACVWCGLPVPGRLVVGVSTPSSLASADDSERNDSKQDDSNDDEYCCFGCRFAAQVSGENGEPGQVRWTLTRLGIAIFFTMNVMVFTMALWSHDIYEIDKSDAFAMSLSGLFRWLCLIAATPVLFLLGVPIAVSAWLELARGRVTTDLLVTFGVAAAFGYSVISVVNGTGHVYFEVSSMVLVMITLGRWLEARGRLETGVVLESLDSLLPETVVVVSGDNEREVRSVELQPGDLIRVPAGERIPVDGIVERFAVSVDQQILTGESAPTVREPGDEVASGGIPVDYEAVVRVTRSVSQGTLSQVLEAVRKARASRGRYQQVADSVTVWFVPAAALIASGAALVRLDGAGTGDAILCGLAVILIACPCALGLATSVAVWAAMYRATQRGILFRSGEVLERLAEVRAVRFDKTGTLTTGVPRVVDVVCGANVERSVLESVTRGLAARSTHVFSRAIVRSLDAASTLGQKFVSSNEQIRVVSGRGLIGQCEIEGVLQSAYLGSERFINEHKNAIDAGLQVAVQNARESSWPVVLVGWSGQVRGVFVLSEELRIEAAAAIDSCRSLKLDVGVLSGDSSLNVERLAERLGIPASGRMSPEDKLRAVEALRTEVGPVLMVGDGINDGPALAGADVAASMGSGTDLSRDASGICLLRDDLRNVPWMIELARQTRRVIRQNLAWAFGYNAVGMTLAAAGLLNPVFAALIMFGSSAVVLANSRRLTRFEASFEVEPPNPEVACEAVLT
jgi:heavy metal translocating P-type ATPase